MRRVPLDQRRNLNEIAGAVEEVFDILEPVDVGPALTAAGLDLLCAARCPACHKQALLQIRAEVDRLIADLGEVGSPCGDGVH